MVDNNPVAKKAPSRKRTSMPISTVLATPALTNTCANVSAQSVDVNLMPVNPLANRADFIQFVTADYTAAGWSTIPTNTINDMIAHKMSSAGKQTMHFIQIGISGDKRFTGEIRNAFVQNAFSNGATPIHAIVDVEKKSWRPRNANTGKFMRI